MGCGQEWKSKEEREADDREYQLEQLKKQRELKRHKIFLRMAKELSKLSHCVSRQVGVLFVKNNHIVASGINGTPSGYVNCDDYFSEIDGWTRGDHHAFSEQYENHGEENCILTAAREGIILVGSIVYASMRPCNRCAKMMAALPIKAFYYVDDYDLEGTSDEIQKFFKEFEIGYYQIKDIDLII